MMSQYHAILTHAGGDTNPSYKRMSRHGCNGKLVNLTRAQPVTLHVKQTRTNTQVALCQQLVDVVDVTGESVVCVREIAHVTSDHGSSHQLDES